ncbi:hypothetical protein [Methanolobus sp.]|uniref:hypothetical protein n=1 Tax=Methanolobus sp. TaxID=1874737 RepID=UPI0025FC15A1|nr:hypothetical protein [Methanolobus sp.]
MEQKTLSSAKKFLLTGKSAKFSLLSLLVLLNLVIRIPSIPHEKGYDSFFIHSLANSISIFGDAQWWIHWLSAFGFYALSYASAVPFILSGMHQLMGIEMEIVILLYCIISGVISIFTAYVLAGRLSTHFIFKYGVALFFSIAPGVMLFSTWEVSTRGLFITLLPLFIYLLMSKISHITKLVLLTLLFIFLFGVHHYGFFLIPIIVVYVTILLLEKTGYLKKINPYSTYILVFLMVLLIGLPFFSRSLVDSGSRYSWLITSSIAIIRQAGPALLLAMGGFIYTLLKKDKSRTELFILSILILFIPAVYSHIYGAYILLLFIILLTGFSVFNMASIMPHTKLASLALISIILLSVAFGSYYNHNRTGESDAYWYMGEGVYAAGMWGRNYVPDNSRGLDMTFETTRVFAVSEGHPITPTIGAGNLAYGFVNESDIEYIQHTYREKDFYFEGPYAVKPGTTLEGRIEWIRQTASSMNQLQAYDYFVQDKYGRKPVVSLVTQNYNRIYDSTRIAMWHFDYDGS